MLSWVTRSAYGRSAPDGTGKDSHGGAATRRTTTSTLPPFYLRSSVPPCEESWLRDRPPLLLSGERAAKLPTMSAEADARALLARARGRSLRLPSRDVEIALCEWGAGDRLALLHHA